jgi:hypothetical protein
VLSNSVDLTSEEIPTERNTSGAFIVPDCNNHGHVRNLGNKGNHDNHTNIGNLGHTGNHSGHNIVVLFLLW